MSAPGETAPRGGAEVPPPVLDALLGIAVAIVVGIAVASGIGGRVPSVGAFLFAVIFGALMMFRRRFPVLVLIITALAICVYYMFDYPAIGLALPMAAALYSAAEQRHLLIASLTGVVLLGLSIVFRLREGEDPALLFGYELVSTAALMAAAIALGDGARSRRELRELGDLREREARASADRERADERLALARELHDDLGHSLSVIALHASSATESLADDPDTARASIGNVRHASTEALRQLRGTVKVLRRTGEPVPTAPEATLTEVDKIADTLREAGLDVRLQVSAPPSLPSGVSAVAYRIVQEATTNVIKHARARQVTIEVHADGPVLRIEVADDGAGIETHKAAGSRAGHGIRGMAERAAALGGTVGVRSETAGTIVSAALPLEENPVAIEERS